MPISHHRTTGGCRRGTLSRTGSTGRAPSAGDGAELVYGAPRRSPRAAWAPGGRASPRHAREKNKKKSVTPRTTRRPFTYNHSTRAQGRAGSMAQGPTKAVLEYIRSHLAEANTANCLSDRELLHRFAAGHEEGAFKVLLQRHGPMVLRVCRRVLQRPEDAEDAFQATFLVLARKAGSLFWRESVGTWLYE